MPQGRRWADQFDSSVEFSATRWNDSEQPALVSTDFVRLI